MRWPLLFTQTAVLLLLMWLPRFPFSGFGASSVVAPAYIRKIECIFNIFDQRRDESPASVGGGRLLLGIRLYGASKSQGLPQ